MSSEADGVERAIWQRVASLRMSPSHDYRHLNRVKNFAFELQREHGGDREVLAAAALLHDLGRADEDRAHGKESLEASVEEAQKVLERLNTGDLSAEQRQKILTAIREHDQPGLKPSTIEGRILKDADFLAGFGAWGILRIAMWSGESGRSLDTLLSRIKIGMAERASNLEFAESRRAARREMLFIELFLSLLNEPVSLDKEDLPGTYIVIEGISGSGKDTQAERLREALVNIGLEVVLVAEPGLFYKACSSSLKESMKAIPEGARKWLFVADRQYLIEEAVHPALEEGKVVISVRSFISTLVHQCQNEVEMAATAFDHRFVPEPDIVLLMDVGPEEAMRRIEDRGKERGLYETLEHLSNHRLSYKALCRQYFSEQLEVIDASSSIPEVHDAVWKKVLRVMDA